MGKQQEKHPFEDNPFLDDLGHWMQSAEGGLSSEVLDVLEGAGKSGCRRQQAQDHLAGWMEMQFAPPTYSQKQLNEMDQLTEK